MSADPLPESVESALHWCARLSAALAEAAEVTGHIARGIIEDWPDDRGREWAERAGLLHRELARDADAATELGGALARPAAVTTADDPDPSGVRLGGTTAARADPERGMRIARLPPPEEPGG